MPSCCTRVAVYDYKKAGKDQICLACGDIIQDAEELTDGWGTGVNSRTKQSGFFPWDYTKPAEEKDLVKLKNLGNVQEKDTKVNCRVQLFEGNHQPPNQTRKDGKLQKGKKTLSFLNTKNKMATFGQGTDHVITPSINILPAGNKFQDAKSHFQTTENLDDSSYNEEGVDNCHEIDYQDGVSSRSRRTRLIGASVIVSVLVSSLIFSNLHFFQEVDIETNCIFTSVVLILLITAVILSHRLRCTTLLVLFSLFAREGRMLFFSLIASFLLNGPIRNILYNSQEMTSSLSCYGDLALQQSAQLQEHIQEVMEKSSLLLKANLEKVQTLADGLTSAMEPLTTGLNAMKQATTAVRGAISDVTSECEIRIKTSYMECNEISNRCSKSRIARGIFDTIADPFKSVPDVVSDPFKKIPDPSTAGEAVSNSWESVKNAICGEVHNLCKPLSVPSNFCSFTSGTVLPTIDNTVDLLRGKLMELQNHLRFQLDFKNQASANAGTSTNTSVIKKAIQEEVEDAFRVVVVITNLLSLCMFFVGICFLFYKCYAYVRCYMTRDKFDNVYVTARLKRVDAKSLEKDKLFPLKKLERRRVVDVTSLKSTKTERKAMFLSLVLFAFSMLATCGVFIVDHALHGLLDIVQRHGDMQVAVEGIARTSFDIPETGLLSRLVKTAVKSFDLSSQYNITMDLSLCLPQGRSPNVSEKYVIAVLYGLTLAVILFQAYGLRMRHKIVAIFYPMRHRERLSYLHKSLTDFRKSYSKTVKCNSRRFANENRILSNRSILFRVKRKAPWFGTVLNRVGLGRQHCVNCRDIVAGSSSTCSHNGSGDSCEGVVYCTACSVDIDKKCPICSTELVVR